MNNVACFTGHRPDKLGGYHESNPVTVDVKERLSNAIDFLISKGVTHFITGMALGVDMFGAELIIQKRAQHPKLHLMAAVPFAGQEKKWPKASQDRFNRILESCDEVRIVCAGGYAARKMQTRNEFMVDHSDYVIAVWDGSSGGTGNCVAYARNAPNVMKVLRIDPRTPAPMKGGE